jgi:hypothetical protein
MPYEKLCCAIDKALKLLPDALALAESKLDRAGVLTDQASLSNSVFEPARDRKQAAECVLRCLDGLRKVQVTGISEPVAKAVNQSLDTAIAAAKAELAEATIAFDAAREALCIARVSLNEHLKPHQPFKDLQMIMKHLPTKVRISTLCQLKQGGQQLAVVAEKVLNAAKAWHPAIGVYDQKAQEYELLLHAYQHLQKVAAYAPTPTYLRTEADLANQMAQVLKARTQLEPAANAALAEIGPIVDLKKALDEIVAELQALGHCSCTKCKS